MTVLAVMTQPMRAAHCRAYLESSDVNEPVVITSDRLAFASSGAPSGARLIVIDPPHTTMSRSGHLADKMRRRFLTWARSGSSAGATAERWARRVSRLLRQRPVPDSPSESPTSQKTDPEPSPLTEALEAVQAKTPLERIVVLDVFDLPAVISFADEHQIAVIVR